jgi:hypothetical protein
MEGGIDEEGVVCLHHEIRRGCLCGHSTVLMGWRMELQTQMSAGGKPLARAAFGLWI